MIEIPNFVKQYKSKVREKNSILCVGVDPALPAQRTTNVISTEDRLGFMRKVIRDVAPYASVIKMNRQYLLGLTADEIREINILIHQNNMLSVIDHKLGDIGSTNASALFWFKEEGFDAFTFSPYGGNISEITNMAHKNGLGVIVLALMSNPEAILHQKALYEGIPLYEHIAKLVSQANSDGCVIGATEHIDVQSVKKLKDILGNEKIILVPGVGTQGGNAKKIIYHFGDNTMVNVGRSIIYSNNPAEVAKEYKVLLNSQRGE